MCMSSSSSAEGIFNLVNQNLVELLETGQPWRMCTSVGVDKTAVNIGIRNSLRTRVLHENHAIYFNGCPCHILHNAARKSVEAFTKCCRFDVEDFSVDLYY